MTDAQIRRLRDEAVTERDWNQVAVCRIALGGRADPRCDLEHEITTTRGRVPLFDLRQDEALAECERVVSDAAANR